MKTFIFSLFAVGLEPTIAAAEVNQTKSVCSRDDTQSALENALSKTVPRVDRLTNYFADVRQARWEFKDFLPLNKDGLVSKCEAITQITLPPNPGMAAVFKAEVERQGIQSFHADASVFYDVMMSDNGNVFVRVTDTQLNSSPGGEFVNKSLANEQVKAQAKGITKEEFFSGSGAVKEYLDQSYAAMGPNKSLKLDSSGAGDAQNVMRPIPPTTRSINPQTPTLLDVQIYFGGEVGWAACGSTGTVMGLDPHGDGFLSVRSGPGGKQFHEIGRVFNGQHVYICEDNGNWFGVVYPAGNGDPTACGVFTTVPKRSVYTGPCGHGWISKRYVGDLAD